MKYPPPEMIDPKKPFLLIGFGSDGTVGAAVNGDLFEIRKAVQQAKVLWPEFFEPIQN